MSKGFLHKASLPEEIIFAELVESLQHFQLEICVHNA